ncbi:ryncolin-2-like [Dysidea avara]|uniref:ryncolin-2-like n=1 Tax=Dysidea avara TaxID=196820 RepID=UPI0033333263
MLLLGVVLADDTCDYGDVVQGDCPIDNCCDLGYGKSSFTYISNKPDIYKIKNFCGHSRSILSGYCDTLTDGGGWLVIQRRQDGSVDFNRDWVDYENGFGSLSGEFWYGLHSIHCLTNQRQWEMRIDYMFTNRTKRYLLYNDFRIGSASERYQLIISDGIPRFSIDPFAHNNGKYFTTKDRDNDQLVSGNCAVDFAGGNAGGWWYGVCSHSVLNHLHNHTYTIYLNDQWYRLPFVEMKIRPKNCIM